MNNSITTTRKDLYNEIWHTALSKLCVKYGVSDNAIRKKCKNNNIPLPDNVYWGKYHAGKNPPIPQLNGDGDIQITFNPTYNPGIKPEPKEKQEPFEYIKDENKRNLILQTYNDLSVNKALYNSHPLIKKHKEQFDKLKNKKLINPNDLHDAYRGYTYKTDYSILNLLSVTENCLHRAYLLLNSLLPAIEKCGGTIEIESNNHSYFVIDSFKIEFKLREKYLRKDNPNKTGYYFDSYIYQPTGILSFVISTSSWQESSFSESSTKTIDTKIKDIFKKVFDVAEQMRLDKIERDERERKWQEERRKEEELRQIRNQEYKKIQQLFSNAELHDKANVIRKYVADINPKTNDESEYLLWATKIADWIDPLSKSNHPFLDENFNKSILDDKHNYW